MSDLEVCPFDAPLGAEIRGVDISKPLTPSAVETIRTAWHDHLVLLFRDQDMSDAQHFAFTAQFGNLDYPPELLLAIAAGEVRVEDEPMAINVISNVIENGKPIGVLGNGEAFWHSDSTFVEIPPAASLLRSLEVPASGGDTYFMNMYQALETLPDELRQAIKGKSSKHDAAYSSSGKRRPQFTELDPSKSTGPIHPLERTHPDTGRKSLYLGRRLGSYIVGLPLDESEDLLNRIWAHVTEGDFIWAQQWRVGDLVWWDNRCAMHRRDAFDPNVRRTMHRTQLAGDRPY